MGLEESRLMELAEPIIEYLKENCHPYASLVITEKRVAVVETVLSIPGTSEEESREDELPKEP